MYQKNTIKLFEKKLRTIIKEDIRNIMNEVANRKEIANQVAREILGTNSFEEFYKNTGLMVNATDFELMSRYFKRLSELTSDTQNY